jgi:spore coat polysaccharide biosynthesis predicted glycosyltransferase SpsG
MRSADLRVLFCVAAGPRRGFGHLLRCRALARALGVRPLIAVRGGTSVVDTALALGCDVVKGHPRRAVAALAPDVVIVDDPIAAPAARWMAAARRRGSLVVSIHDLGRGHCGGDLVVDGSVTRTPRRSRRRTLAGPRFAVVDPSLRARRRATGRRPRVLISLGGGPRAALAAAIAREIARLAPDAEIRIAAGFLPAADRRVHSKIRWIKTPDGLGAELAAADVAVVGGGVSLYEACVVGVPAVAVPVVKEQEPTVRAMVRRGAALGRARVGTAAAVVAGDAGALLGDANRRRVVARTARALVDGAGAARVAAVITTLANRDWRSPCVR